MACMHFGIRANLVQVLHQLLQVLLVGMTIGMMRNVVPALAESEFGVQRGSFMLLVAFVVAFGFVKGAMNFVAGRLAETLGRRRVLLVGWLVALPIPPIIYFAPSWNWIVAATVLLGINQGLTWSMTQTAKLDLTRPDQRGLVIGLNEFSGYVGVALAAVITGYAATLLGPRAGLLWFGGLVIGIATLLAWLAVAETLPWAKAETRSAAAPVAGALRPPVSDRNRHQPDDCRDVRIDVLARPSHGGAQSGRPGREICGCPGLGVLACVPAPARRGSAGHRLDRGCVWVHVGCSAVLYGQGVGPGGTTAPECLGHVDLWCWRSTFPAGQWVHMVERIRRSGGSWHGDAVPEPQCSRRRHRSSQLACLCDWNLSLLARPGLWHRGPRPRLGCDTQWRP